MIPDNSMYPRMTLILSFFFWLLRQLEKEDHPAEVYEGNKVNFEMVSYLLSMGFHNDATDSEVKAVMLTVEALDYFKYTERSSLSGPDALGKVRAAIAAMELAGFDIPF